MDLSNGESELDGHGQHYPLDHATHHHSTGHHSSSRVFTFSNPPQGQPVRSMDALLEAAEQMRQREEEEQQKRDAAAVVLASGVSHLPPRRRPENISIPGSAVLEHDRTKRRRSMSPPPIMSPRPSMYYNILSPKSSQPSTPGIRNRQSELILRKEGRGGEGRREGGRDRKGGEGRGRRGGGGKKEGGERQRCMLHCSTHCVVSPPACRL